MGALANAALARGGDIVGVIPGFLIERERIFRGAGEMVPTTDMHERKRIMFERSDAGRRNGHVRCRPHIGLTIDGFIMSRAISQHVSRSYRGTVAPAA